MKNQIALTFILLLSIHRVCAQGSDQKKQLSASISFSPVKSFYYYHPDDEYENFFLKGIKELVYPIGFNLAINQGLNERITISSGLNLKSTSNENYRRHIYEIPVNLKYRILQNAKVFGPYICTGIRGSLFNRYYIGKKYYSSTINDQFDKVDSKAIIFSEIGTGICLNIHKSFSLCLGANLTYAFSGFGYTEYHGGLEYKFN